MQSNIYIGPAGWSYPDWNGIVYPVTQPRGFDPLVFMASYFNLIEINSTFYRIPSPRTCARWAERVAVFPDFVFTVKAFRDITHGKVRASQRDIDTFVAAIRPLLQSGRLSRVLIQFPWSFRFEPENADYVARLHDGFAAVPTSFEVRHGSWGSEPAVTFMADRHINMCGIDQPLIGDSLPPDRFNGEDRAVYFRLHGRNSAEWFKPGNNRDQRYNYFYSHEAMQRWSSRIQDAARVAHRVHVVLNNHFRGQAAANALELMSILSGEPARAPATLIRTYPRLSEMLARDRRFDEVRQPGLFDEENNEGH